MTGINETAKKAYDHAIKSGFISEDRSIDDMLMDIIDEISEARKSMKFNLRPNWIDYELYRGYDIESNFQTNLKSTLDDELIDLILIPMAIAIHFGVDIEKHIVEKIEYNKVRKDHKSGE